MKLSVLYYSKTGHTKALADILVQSAMKIEGVEAKAFSIEDVDADFVNESKAVIFGTPIYTANMCWQMKKWLDTKPPCKLAGKLGAVYASAKYQQGAAGAGLSSLIDHLLCHGMLMFSGGLSYGAPFTHLGAVALDDRPEENAKVFNGYGERIARMAMELFG